MDINSLLPFLLNKGKKEEANQNDSVSMLIKNMGQNSNANPMLMNILGENLQKQRRRKPMGLSPIKFIATDCIIGRLVKYFTR